VKNCIAINVDRSSWDKYFDEIPDFYVFLKREKPEHVVDPSDDGLCYCSSVPSAIDMALQMGCKQVMLLGVDHYALGDKTHFWQLWPKEQQPTGTYAPINMQKKVFNFSIQTYKALKEYANYMDAEIYNCNFDSKLKVFPNITFNDALDIIK
jgi:hypothetical protein